MEVEVCYERRRAWIGKHGLVFVSLSLSLSFALTHSLIHSLTCAGLAQTRIRALERRDTELEQKLSDANQELVTLRVTAASAAKLAKENEFLRKELGSFDAEFFEEIEDLKYNYSRALDEIRELKRGRA